MDEFSGEFPLTQVWKISLKRLCGGTGMKEQVPRSRTVFRSAAHEGAQKLCLNAKEGRQGFVLMAKHTWERVHQPNAAKKEPNKDSPEKRKMDCCERARKVKNMRYDLVW